MGRRTSYVPWKLIRGLPIRPVRAIFATALLTSPGRWA
ncbi:hypothetical protein SMICM17S_13272 [Streptomyces microflavus]